MLPIGPLMIEHRLIERMIQLMEKEILNIKQNDEVNVKFVDKAIDFLKTYADRCHHGKEEDILFRELAQKALSTEHKKIMDELLKEHVLGRGYVKNLVEGKERYQARSQEATKIVAEHLRRLVDLYPKHIEKEDKHFFIPAMNYLSNIEKEAMLKKFWEFDKQLIHEKYGKILEELEKG